MGYTEEYERLKSVYDPDLEEMNIEGSRISIHNVGFTSVAAMEGFMNRSDFSIPENLTFSYPLFAPADRKSTKVILLLHGLNERSWIKYLVWAYYLAKNTGSYVILFPLSFHINRSPVKWKDPRAMVSAVKDRITVSEDIRMSTFANVALSKRLNEDPLRFFNSGHQTAYDIIKLLKQIRNGEHPMIPGGSTVDIFAYSIGAFLAEIMMMGNPENLLDESKLFIFCGGSVFSNMCGTSKLIMDSAAFDRVYSYYLNDFESSIKGKSPLTDFLSSTMLGMAFRSMIDLARFRLFRENILKKLAGRIHTITMSEDLVIPAKGVVATLGHLFPGKSASVEVLNFPYACTHENPFPVFNSPLSQKVDISFEQVFSTARSFFCYT